METFTPRVMNPVLHWMILVAVANIWHGSASPTISPNVSTVTVNSGDRVTFLCSGNSSVKWVGVENATRVKVYTNGTLSISKALCKHMGIYKCAYVNNTDVKPAFIYLSVRGSHTPWCLRQSKIVGTEDRDVLFPCLLANPEVSGNITLLKDNNDTISSGISFNAREGIRLHKVNMNHRGSYQCQALIQGQWLKSPEISLTVEKIHPVSVIVERKEYVRIKGEPFNVTCKVSCNDNVYSGAWIHSTTNRSFIDTGREMLPEPSYRYTTAYILFIPAVQFNDSGKYICFGKNKDTSNFSEVILHVTEKGFVHLSTIQKTSYEIKLHGSLNLLVLVEAYPSLLQWKWTLTNPSTSFKNFTYSDQMSSVNHRSNNTLELHWLEETDSGMYTFFAENSVSNASITFNITMKIPPKVIGFQNSSSLSCQATGYPSPHIQWYKLPRHHHSVRCSQGGILLMKDTSPQIMTKVPFGKVSVESTLDIGATESNVTFCCLAVNSEGKESYIFTSVILGGVFSNATYDVSKPVISACVGTVVLLLLFIIFLLYKYKQKPKYQVRWKIIEACEGNNYIFIDPTQLPYNEKWEFPRNNLKFGKILGAGAFGKVVEATAFGLGKEDSNLKVAVKMLKSTAHTDEQEALISELKIMSHLGHHENIVNLLGACTHGGPVLVITEYCPYGDLLNFLRKKAEEAFTTQDVNVESLPESLTTDYKNIYLAKKYIRSDSGFGNHSVDHYLEMKPVTTSVSMQAKESTAETEDSHPLSIHDLLQFSNQVAEGMSFLASKNCIHRDLAARNVLLADGRVAKICDFGLARDIMNDANYVVKGNARLPVKWMAPESIFECVYTVQSDVWSYGILLWEIFSLGRSPYPGMKVNGDFYRMVKQGYHMGRPDFAPEFMYNIMKACWNLEPTKRPTFSQICSYIEKQLAADKEQDYRNLPREERDSGCEEASFCEESCESVESKQPLLNSNNYQFC